MPIEIGSGQFIPGFEDQLVGAKVGDKVKIAATFPEAYSVAILAGKPADFDVTVKSVESPKETPVDDNLPRSLGSRI